MKFFHCKSLTARCRSIITITHSLNIFAALYASLLPTVPLIAYDTLVSHPVTLRVPFLTENLAELAKDIIKFPWDEMRSGRASADSIISSIRDKEILICRANSLLRKVRRVQILFYFFNQSPSYDISGIE